MKNVKGALQSLAGAKRGKVTEMALGSTTGFVTGYCTMMVGRGVIFLAGGGILLYQGAQSFGFTQKNWEDARAKARTLEEKLKNSTWQNRVTTYAQRKQSFAGSFVGGFLIGAACNSN